MTIQKKLYLAFGAAFTVGLLTTAVGVVSLRHMSAAVAELTGASQQATYDAGQIDTITSDMQAEQRGTLMRRYAGQDAASDKLISDYEASIAALHHFADDYQSVSKSADAKAKLQIVTDSLITIDKANPAFLNLVRQKDLQGALKVLDSGLNQATDNASTQGAQLLELQQKLAQEEGKARVAEAAQENAWMLLMLLPLIAVGVALGVVIRGLVDQLKKSTQNLAESAEEITSAASQVAESSSSLAQGASQQAATIEETSSASNEINSMARRATESARKTAEMVTRSQASSSQTDESLNKMLTAMDGIGTSSQKISKIIKVIDEIAFQTNILALNAAVEAARAGEAGMGFAVVADEVRNLAQRCAQAARDTTDLIEESVQRAVEGREIVGRVAESTRGITADSSKIKVLVDEISIGSEEQSRGIDQISKAIHDMENVTQGNAAGAEESAAAAQQLTAQAEAMNEAVRRLKSLVYSGGQQEASGDGFRRARAA
jgi:methyl-accepting chemotaxis protein/methyl-accepting chemotaxis protein-1 (serine sensor receptor)